MTWHSDTTCFPPICVILLEVGPRVALVGAVLHFSILTSPPLFSIHFPWLLSHPLSYQSLTLSHTDNIWWGMICSNAACLYMSCAMKWSAMCSCFSMSGSVWKPISVQEIVVSFLVFLSSTKMKMYGLGGGGSSWKVRGCKGVLSSPERAEWGGEGRGDQPQESSPHYSWWARLLQGIKKHSLQC